jgi:hypothetical protein
VLPRFSRLDSLVHFDMSNCNMSGPIPLELGRLANLDTLTLHRNHLFWEISAELNDLKSLRSLDLIEEIPSALLASPISSCPTS